MLVLGSQKSGDLTEIFRDFSHSIFFAFSAMVCLTTGLTKKNKVPLASSRK
jgi:hypothetical protein